MKGENGETNHLRAKAYIIHEKLIQAYGQPVWRPHMDAISEVVSTILSQNTNDGNRDRAFNRLRAAFPTWEMVRDAPVEEIAAAINPAGLAPQKAPRIKQALQFITAQRGTLDLDFLKNMPVQQAREWLMQIKGVGPKTAAIVLLFALGRPAFPVDTHIYRVTRRLGLVDSHASVEKAHEIMERLLDPEMYYAFHLNVIRHGREVCQARNPRCAVCILKDWCDYYHFQNR
ncbi:MAG: endonuclease III domain-containing protein [Anaerolineae bacterium]